MNPLTRHPPDRASLADGRDSHPRRGQVQRHAEVQALVYGGLAHLRHARFVLLRVADAQAARAWLRRPEVLDLVLCGDRGRSASGAAEALMLAFSHAGLLALGLRPSAEFPFPSAFREGMTHPQRARALGDQPSKGWTWGDTEDMGRGFVHVLLGLYARAAPALDRGHFAPAGLRQGGFEVVADVRTCARHLQVVAGDDGATDEDQERAPQTPHDGSRPNARAVVHMIEPFGFRDGISQPRLYSGPPRPWPDHVDFDHFVAEGEFVLGQFNEYGDRAYAPDAVGWAMPTAHLAGERQQRFGTLGTYLAVRQIWQDVAEFSKAEAALPQPNGPSVAERMMGRRRNGEPLVPLAAGSSDKLNGFRYAVQDAEGFHCPLGAHVRRANPRDMFGATPREGVAQARLHRLLRRARVYTNGCVAAGVSAGGVPACAGPPGEGRPGAVDPAAVARAEPRPCGAGLFFIALNADLDRQFEFVQQRWIGNASFADLAAEPDPIVGPAGPRFTVPGAAMGGPCPTLPGFTRVVGGGYFFLPSLSALRFLAAGPPAHSGEIVGLQRATDGTDQ